MCNVLCGRISGFSEAGVHRLCFKSPDQKFFNMTCEGMQYAIYSMIKGSMYWTSHIHNKDNIISWEA